MKTIFEGTVNGVVYNNVNDYNAAVTEAIKNNEPVQASSSTRTVQDTVGDTPENVELNLFPEFDLDTLTGDDNQDRYYMEAFTEGQLNDGRRHIIANAVRQLTDEEYETFAVDYKDSIQQFDDKMLQANESKEKVLKQIATMKKIIGNLKRDLRILNSGLDILQMEKDFYTHLLQVTARPKKEKKTDIETQTNEISSQRVLSPEDTAALRRLAMQICGN